MKKAIEAWPEMDILRGLGVLSMVLFHSISWLWTVDATNKMAPFAEGILIRNGIWFGIPALWLPIVAGSSLAIRNQKEKNSGFLGLPSPTEIILLGILFFSLATLGNLLLWSDHSVWRWDILHFVASCFLIYGILDHCSLRGLLIPLALLAMMLGSPVWDPWRFIGVTPPEVWPLTPWFAIFVLGVELAKYRPLWRVGKRWWIPFLAGGVAALLGILTPSGREWILTAHPFRTALYLPPTEIFISLMGLYVLTLITIERFFVRFPKRRGVPPSLAKISGAALWIFILHMVIGVPLAELFWNFLGPKRALIAFPTYLLLVSWAIGEMTGMMREKRIRIRLTKVNSGK